MKICQVPNCSFPVFGKGFCKYHQWKREDYDRRTPMQKHFDKLKSENKNTTTEDSELEKWYKKIAKEIAKYPHCANCGELIAEKYFRHATAHILPKATFTSVATHPLNYIIAGASCGCHNETHRWDLFQKMNIWPLALERIEMMLPELSQEEIRRLPEEIINHINNKQPF